MDKADCPENKEGTKDGRSDEDGRVRKESCHRQAG